MQMLIDQDGLTPDDYKHGSAMLLSILMYIVILGVSVLVMIKFFGV